MGIVPQYCPSGQIFLLEEAETTNAEDKSKYTPFGITSSVIANDDNWYNLNNTKEYYKTIMGLPPVPPENIVYKEGSDYSRSTKQNKNRNLTGKVALIVWAVVWVLTLGTFGNNNGQFSTVN